MPWVGKTADSQIITRRGTGKLGEIIGPDRIEIDCKPAGCHGGGRHLQHHSERRECECPALGRKSGGRFRDVVACCQHFRRCGDHRQQEAQGAERGSPEDGPQLDAEQIRASQRQAEAAQAQKGIALALDGIASHRLVTTGIERADRDREAPGPAKQPRIDLELSFLIGKGVFDQEFRPHEADAVAAFRGNAIEIRERRHVDLDRDATTVTRQGGTGSNIRRGSGNRRDGRTRQDIRRGPGDHKAGIAIHQHRPGQIGPHLAHSHHHGDAAPPGQHGHMARRASSSQHNAAASLPIHAQEERWRQILRRENAAGMQDGGRAPVRSQLGENRVAQIGEIGRPRPEMRIICGFKTPDFAGHALDPGAIGGNAGGDPRFRFSHEFGIVEQRDLEAKDRGFRARKPPCQRFQLGAHGEHRGIERRALERCGRSRTGLAGSLHQMLDEPARQARSGRDARNAALHRAQSSSKLRRMRSATAVTAEAASAPCARTNRVSPCAALMRMILTRLFASVQGPSGAVAISIVAPKPLATCVSFTEGRACSPIALVSSAESRASRRRAASCRINGLPSVLPRHGGPPPAVNRQNFRSRP